MSGAVATLTGSCASGEQEVAGGEDVLILNRGGQGALADCDQSQCTFAAVAVPRAMIAWIGLEPEILGPPTSAGVGGDEVHMRDGAIHTSRLLAVTVTMAETEDGSFPRADVAWIRLADQPTRWTKEEAATDPTGFWEGHWTSTFQAEMVADGSMPGLARGHSQKLYDGSLEARFNFCVVSAGPHRYIPPHGGGTVSARQSAEWKLHKPYVEPPRGHAGRSATLLWQGVPRLSCAYPDR